MKNDNFKSMDGKLRDLMSHSSTSPPPKKFKYHVNIGVHDFRLSP